jgi:flagellar hook-associated protein 2
MASISFGGLASGLDTNAIVSQLMELERQPISRLENDKKYLSSRLSAFSNFEGKLKDLLTSFQDIDTSDELRSYSATSASEEFFSLTASSTAGKGDYDIEVVSLAQVQKDVSAGYSSSTSAAFSAGTVSIDNGSTVTDITITDGESLSAIVDKINLANTGDSATGISASLINDGTANGSRIVLTGEDASTIFTATSDISAESTALTFSNTQLATQASIKVDNITIVSDNNTITGAIPGVTLNLLKTNAAAETTHMTVNVDTDGVTSKINSFVNNFNDIIDFIAEQKDTSWGNDSGMRNTKRYLQNLLVTSANGTGQYQYLVDLGISSDQKTGKISIDSTKLNNAISNNLEDVEKLIVGEDAVEGIADKFISYLESMTDSSEGLYASRKTSTENSIRSIENNISQMELRLIKREQTMKQQFYSLELLMSQMNSTSSYLSQQMTMISNMSGGGK